VFATLHCTSGKSSDQVELIGCADREHAFESGRIDTFELVRALSIIISRPFFLCELRSHFQIIPLLPATICAITVSVDNIDGGSTWNLQEIIVTDVSHNSTHTFHNSKPLGIHHPSEILGHRRTRALSTDAGRRASFFDFSAANPTTISKTVAPLSGAHTKPDYMGILWVETSKFKLCSSCRSVEHCWERVRQKHRVQSNSSHAHRCSLFSGAAASFSSRAPTSTQRPPQSTRLFKRSRWQHVHSPHPCACADVVDFRYISGLELSPLCPRSRGHTTRSPSPFKYTRGWNHVIERANSASVSRLQRQVDMHQKAHQLKRLKCENVV